MELNGRRPRGSSKARHFAQSQEIQANILPTHKKLVFSRSQILWSTKLPHLIGGWGASLGLFRQGHPFKLCTEEDSDHFEWVATAGLGSWLTIKCISDSISFFSLLNSVLDLLLLLYTDLFCSFYIARNSTVFIPYGFLFILRAINTLISELPDTTSNAANYFPPPTRKGLCENSGLYAQRWDC